MSEQELFYSRCKRATTSSELRQHQRSKSRNTVNALMVDIVAKRKAMATTTSVVSNNELSTEVELSKNVIQFTNCRILRDHTFIEDDLWVQDGLIIDPRLRFWDVRRPADVVVNCGGHLIAPGFIDMQINGAFGIDFSSMCARDDADNAVDMAVSHVAHGLIRHGVTSFLPTLVTSSPADYAMRLPRIRPRAGGISQGATVLGCHCEGPFISEKKKGAHLARLIRPMISEEDILACYGGPNGLANVRVVTLAPELPGAIEAVRVLTQTFGITVSLGHSMAGVELAEEAVSAGASMLTHLFNAMPPFHHRDPGLVGLLAARAKVGSTALHPPPRHPVFYGLICDGIHAAPQSIEIAFSTNPKGAVVVTDAMAAMGLPPGLHKLGEHTVDTRSGKALLEGSTDTLAGSIVRMDTSVSNLMCFSGCSLEEALEATSYNPAIALGLEGKKGTLNYGADADFVLLDINDGIRIHQTWIAGQCVYDSSKEDLDNVLM